jgi:hypothetical protein
VKRKKQALSEPNENRVGWGSLLLLGVSKNQSGKDGPARPRRARALRNALGRPCPLRRLLAIDFIYSLSHVDAFSTLAVRCARGFITLNDGWYRAAEE